jgi:hypothetical protein
MMQLNESALKRMLMNSCKFRAEKSLFIDKEDDRITERWKIEELFDEESEEVEDQKLELIREQKAK